MNKKEMIILCVLLVSLIGFFLLTYNLLFSSIKKENVSINKTNIKYSNLTPELKPVSLNDLQELATAAEKSGKILKCIFVTKRYSFLGADIGVCKGVAYVVDHKYFILKFNKISYQNPYLSAVAYAGLDKVYGVFDGDILYLYFKMNNGTYYFMNTAITKKLDDFKWDNVLAYCTETDEKIEIPKTVKNKEKVPPIENIIFS